MGQLKRKPDGLGKSKTYLGKVAVPAKPAVTVGNLDGIDKGSVMQKLTIREIKFIEAYATADGRGVTAMSAMFPKLSYQAAHRKANRWMHKIDSKISPEEKFALMGLTTGLVARVIREAADAKFRKEFVTKDGALIVGEEHDDHQIRLDAIKLAAKVIGLDKESNNPTIAINIVQYAPPGSAPWPAGGSTNPEIDITPGGEEI
jgi:hypothetical protein